MKNKIAIIFTFVIVVGVLALAFNTILGRDTIMLLEKERIVAGTTSFYIYKIDIGKYIQNIQLATSNISILVFDMPSRQFVAVQTLSDIGNNIAVLIDYVIMIINVMLYPIKIGSYLLQNVLAIVGINNDTTNINNGLAWLVIFVRDILSRIVIPYI